MGNRGLGIMEGRRQRHRGTKWIHVVMTLVVMGGVSLAACSRKSQPQSKTDSPASASARTAPEAPTDPVEAMLSNITQHCSFNEAHAAISKCENNEKQSAIRDFNTGKLSRVDALPKLVEALGSPDRKRSVAASKLLESAFRNSLGTHAAQAVSKPAAAQLVTLLSTLPERQAAQVAPAAVHAAMSTGQQEALYKALDEHPNQQLRASAYVYLLRYGTLAELPKIKSLVDGKDERVAASAVEALRRMPGQKPEDVKRICDFVAPLAEDPREVVAGKVTAQLVNCGGTYLDAALAGAQKRQKISTLGPAIIRGFDQTCTRHQGKTAGSESQCAKLRGLLEHTVQDSKSTEEARQFALLGLGLQFQDAATLALAEKYVSAPEKRLKSAAERVTRSVGARLKSSSTGSQTSQMGTRTRPASLPRPQSKVVTGSQP